MNIFSKFSICVVFVLCLNSGCQNSRDARLAVSTQKEVSIIVEDGLSDCANYGIDKIVFFASSK